MSEQKLLPYHRSLLYFGFCSILALAPLLGNKKVPGFSALIEMYPVEVQDWLIPLSGFFLAMIGVIVELASLDIPSKRKLKRWHIGIVSVFVVSFITLLFVYLWTVVHIDKAITEPNKPPDRISIAVITGTSVVPPQRPGSKCGCLAGEPAEECIGDISLNPVNVRRCFGSQRIILATLALSVLYLVLLGSFAAAVGLLFLRKKLKAAEKRT